MHGERKRKKKRKKIKEKKKERKGSGFAHRVYFLEPHSLHVYTCKWQDQETKGRKYKSKNNI